MGLRERLRRIRSRSGESIGQPAIRRSRSVSGGKPEVLDTWNDKPNGLWERSLSYAVSFPEFLDPRPFFRKGRPETELDPIPSDKLLFFDLETTGLSGGAGTVAFLAALGHLEGSSLIVQQYFMDDYPAEPEFLEALSDKMESEKVLVSFNGRSFDEPLLRTRLTMNRMPVVRNVHVDAIHPARRLWKRMLGSCSLSDLETGALGMEARDDIPGSQIPEVWFSFLEHGEDARMERVFEHNALDIRSLALLTASCSHAFAAPLERDDVDLVGLGKKLSDYDLIAARGVLAQALKQGDEQAAWPLYILAKRAGDSDCARDALKNVPDSWIALLEKARFAWRVDKNGKRALTCLKNAGRFADSEGKKAELEKRMERLMGKTANVSGKA